MGLDRHRYRGSCPPQKSLGRKVSSAKLFTLLMQKPRKGGLPAAVVAAQCLAWAGGSGKLLAKAPFPAPFLPLLPQTQQKQWPKVSRAWFSCPSPQSCCGRSNPSPGRSTSSSMGSNSILPTLPRSPGLPFMGKRGENLGGEVTLVSSLSGQLFPPSWVFRNLAESN